MLLLPGSLPADRATLKALCEGLAAHPDMAMRLRSCTVEPFTGSWSDAERAALGLAGDLCDGQTLASITPSSTGGGHQNAVATPLSAVLGLTDLTPLDPALISLNEHESRTLCEACDQHLSVDGVRLSFVDANTWLVTCVSPISVLTERPDWLIGEPLRPNLPRGKDARLVERWMNELQMLLFSHPVNAAREERGLPPINLVWLWGFGSMIASVAHGRLPLPPAGEGWGEGGSAPTYDRWNTHTLTPNPSPARGREEQTPLDFLTALRNGNVPAWQDAWLKLSPQILTTNSIILGDSRPRLRLTLRKASAASRLTSLFQRKPTLAEMLVTLQQQL